MDIKYGQCKYGPNIQINLTGSEVAIAIDAYLVAHEVYVSGPRTTRIDGDLLGDCSVHVDPIGNVIYKGRRARPCVM